MTVLNEQFDLLRGISSPFVVAEIGVNHDGDPARALELVDAAASSGADAIKMQWFEAKRLVSASADLVDYQKAAGETDPTGMLQRLELDRDAMVAVIDRARTHGLKSIVTVFSPELVPVAAELEWDAFKTASPDLVNRPLLEALAGDGRPLILSTGCSTIPEISDALDWVGRKNLALLHCVSSYPTPVADAALGGIPALAETFGLPVGYSDHTTDPCTGGLAVAAGASILEKHLTWNVDAPGPDHAASMSPGRFGEYVAFARRSALMFGRRTKHVLPSESEVRTGARQSLAFMRDLTAGTIITAEDLTTMRPGNGISPACLPEILGLRLARDVRRGTLIQRVDLLSSEMCS